MASANTQNQSDPLDEQQFLSNEFNRSKLLVQKFTDRQHEMGLEKIMIEEAIMKKVEKGEDDSEDWKKLNELRHEINCLADEKLLIV